MAKYMIQINDYNSELQVIVVECDDLDEAKKWCYGHYNLGCNEDEVIELGWATYPKQWIGSGVNVRDDCAYAIALLDAEVTLAIVKQLIDLSV